MQVFTTSEAARIDRGQELGAPHADPAASRPVRRIEPDPFVNFLGVIIPRSELVRAGHSGATEVMVPTTAARRGLYTSDL